MSGCEMVFHVAADYRLWVRDPEQMYRANVEGTRAVLEAARKNRRAARGAHLERRDHGVHSNGRPADEDSPVSLESMIGPYKRSKFMAEQVAHGSRARRYGRGGGESHHAGWRAGHQAHAHRPHDRGLPEAEVSGVRRYRVEPGGRSECARGHVAALEKGRSGERYILGGENLTLKQILDRLAAITGLPSPKVRVPYAVALATGVVDKWLPDVFSGASRA